MKHFEFFSFHIIKMEQQTIYFGENGIIIINEVHLQRIKLSDKKSFDKDSFK